MIKYQHQVFSGDYISQLDTQLYKIQIFKERPLTRINISVIIFKYFVEDIFLYKVNRLQYF